MTTYKTTETMNERKESRPHNFSYPSAAAVVFGVHLSARYRVTGTDIRQMMNAMRTCV